MKTIELVPHPTACTWREDFFGTALVVLAVKATRGDVGTVRAKVRFTPDASRVAKDAMRCWADAVNVDSCGGGKPNESGLTQGTNLWESGN